MYVQVDANLAAADIPQSLFDAIVSADAFERLKPSPGACAWSGAACIPLLWTLARAWASSGRAGHGLGIGSTALYPASQCDAAPPRRLPPPPADIFLAAAAQLGVPPANCVVIEDAVAGVEAARAAGEWHLGLGGGI